MPETRRPAATIGYVAKVKNTSEVLDETDHLIERQTELAAGIRALGTPNLEPLAKSLEEGARKATEAASTIRPALEDAETLAVSRVRNGQVTGSTSIQDYMDENGLTEADLEK